MAQLVWTVQRTVLDRTNTMVPRSFSSYSRHHTDGVSLASHPLTLNRLLTLNTTGSLNEREVMLIVYRKYFNIISDSCLLVSGQYQKEDGDTKNKFMLSFKGVETQVLRHPKQLAVEKTLITCFNSTKFCNFSTQCTYGFCMILRCK